MIDTQFRALHTKLRAIARNLMAQERISHTLETDAIIGDLYIALCASGLPDWVESPGVFLSVAKHRMKNALTDHARAKGALKRGGAMERQDGDAVLRVPRSMSAAETAAFRDRVNKILREGVEAGHLTPRQATSFTLVKLFWISTAEAGKHMASPEPIPRRTVQRDVEAVQAYVVAMLEAGA